MSVYKQPALHALSIRVGDYVGNRSIETMLDWSIITIDEVVNRAIFHVEYFTKNSNRWERVNYYIKEHARERIIILSENNPEHKILIDRFKIAKMQCIIET